jgi:hypothetical protein
MKVFFLTQFYFDLHKPILNELKKQGHDVYLEKDIYLLFDPNFRKESIITRITCSFLRKIFKVEIKYWKNKIKNNNAYNERYDIFLCIDGTSYHPYLLNHLKKTNPNIKAILYLWDTNKYYNFLRYKESFDRIFSFDIEDAEKEKGVEVLHSYWYPSLPQRVIYKLFVVGSDHDDRIDIISKVYEQVEMAKLPSFMRVVIKKPRKKKGIIKHLCIGKNNYERMMNIWKEKKALPFTTEDIIPVDQILSYIDQTECILDTDMPVQTGATERVIWALARGKKIISTNYNLKRLPFFDDRQIKFIDRKNPVIDIDFLVSKNEFPIPEEIQELRIDRWIHKLIDL